MKTIAAHALCVQLRRQREHLGNLRIAAVERSVEAGHLRQLRQTFEQQADRREIVRLVQRRQRNEFLERLQHLRVDSYGPAELEPAMHDAVAYANQSRTGLDSRADERRDGLARRRGRARRLRPRTAPP